MKKRSRVKNHRSAISPPAQELLTIAALAFAVSLISLSYYFQHQEILLYGDAIAHINIARRVFDSQTPGLLQLGTVWLPLPHLLMIPFLLSNGLWQTGIGGSIPSMLAYVFGVVGIFRLTRGLIKVHTGIVSVAKIGSWMAALVYAANPNLIYLQTTAMTESLSLAFFIWAIVYLAEFAHTRGKSDPEGLKPSKPDPIGTANNVPFPKAETNEAPASLGPLWKCAVCVAGAELTRYDGWLLAAAIAIALVAMAIGRGQEPRLRWAALKFVMLVAVVPSLWLAYNAAVYGNAFEFATGPYSAKAIEQRSVTPGMPSNPGTGNVVLAGRYFLKSAELNMASGNWGRIWIVIAVAGLIFTFTRIRRTWPLLLLWLPLFFYALSIAYGGVPLFVPAWWPFTFYNVRYGIQLLPLFAVSAGLIATALWTSLTTHTASGEGHVTPSHNGWSDTNRLWSAIAGVCAIFLIVAFSYFSVWKAQPICFAEASVNSRTKITLEAAVARIIRGLPRTSNYLMYLGDHVGAFEQAGIPLRQVINEGNHRPWKRPSDPEGLWERALDDPARHADFVIAFDNDPVDRAVDKSRLTVLSVIHTTGQPEARIYATRRN